MLRPLLQVLQKTGDSWFGMVSKREEDSCSGLASFHQHKRSQLWNNHQPPCPGWRQRDEEQVLPVAPQRAVRKGCWLWGQLSTQKAGWLPSILHPPRAKGDVAMLCYWFQSPRPTKRVVESSKVHHGRYVFFLAGHTQLAFAQSISILHRLWLKGF